MLRVSTIYASAARSAAAYYTRYLAEAPGEVPGVWAGRQAAALGLGIEVAGDDPATAAVEAAAANIQAPRSAITTATTLSQWNRNTVRLHELQALQATIDDWQHWAAGQPLDPYRIATMATTLRTHADAGSVECRHLVTPVLQWATDHRINLPRRPPHLSLGIEC